MAWIKMLFELLIGIFSTSKTPEVSNDTITPKPGNTLDADERAAAERLSRKDD